MHAYHHPRRTGARTGPGVCCDPVALALVAEGYVYREEGA